MGDPAGVGPELCLRVLSDTELLKCAIPVVVGDRTVLQEAAERCQQSMAARHIERIGEVAGIAEPSVLHVPDLDATSWQPGTPSAATGQASYRYIETAIQLALRKDVQGVTTGPIQKSALKRAGIDFPGHTEIFADKTGAADVCMMLTSDVLTCTLVTTHIGLREVPAQLSTERILSAIHLTHQALTCWYRREPTLCVCGLNPHAGESGQFGGGEEEQIIAPAVLQARSQAITISGPVPPDTAFIPERRSHTDAYICMYHDQGLIPLKTLAFDSAVNVTLGLPIVRTSVDHGTALDIAWQGKADCSSMVAAVKLAAKMAEAESTRR